jgi:hypothetical protein
MSLVRVEQASVAWPATLRRTFFEVAVEKSVGRSSEERPGRILRRD